MTNSIDIKPAKPGSKVLVHYTGTLNDGSIFDTSKQEGREPLSFVMGQGQLLQGFEQAVLDHVAGETVKVTLPPKDAYGEYDPTQIFGVPREQVPDFIPLEVGTKVKLTSQGQVLLAQIKEITPEEVILDGNHELAGKTLTFEIEILEVS
ncbi:MAG: peptidylprolyl isomerase [Desulfovibrionaceae bacterium]|nr:peptidylprolyl isomerase [Desulfovibrionaceae bacterium]